jgi:hypothetical protein
LVYFKAIWYILPNFGIFYPTLVYFTQLWYILPHFGIFYPTLVYFTQLWYILPNFGIFYPTLVYFTQLWYILLTFSIFYGHLVYNVVIWYIFPFWYVVPRKILATLNYTPLNRRLHRYKVIFSTSKLYTVDWHTADCLIDEKK